MIRAGLWPGLAGLAAATALVIYQGAGWGLLWVALYHAAPVFANARARQVLLSGQVHPSFGFLAWMVWVREGSERITVSGRARIEYHPPQD